MRGYQTFFKDGEATVGQRESSLVCSELFEELGGNVVPLADTDVECQRQKDVYSFVQNNKDIGRD